MLAYSRDKQVVEIDGILYTTKEPEIPGHRSQRYLCRNTDKNRWKLNGNGIRFFNALILEWIQKGKDNAKLLNLDCSKCGACCQSLKDTGLEWGINIDSGKDAKALESIRPGCLIARHGFIGSDPYMDVESGHCPFWKGKFGESSHCTIYKRRPRVCYAFGKGNDICLRLRRVLFDSLELGHLVSDAERAIELQMPQYGKVEPVKNVEPLQEVA